MRHRIEPLAVLPLRRVAALIPIALAGLLIAGGAASAAAPASAPASSAGLGGSTSAAAEPEEEVEWEWGEEEEFEEGEFEEGEEEIEVELEFEEEAPLAPKRSGHAAACVAQSAKARVVASNVSDTLHLSLRYVSREPVRVEVHYGVEGTRSAAHLDPMTLHAARHGQVDYTDHPGIRRMSKLRAAHALVVTIEMPGTSRTCGSYTSRHLTSKQHGHAKTIWSEAPQHPRAHHQTPVRAP